MEHVFITEIENSPAVCYHTGLDPRSFARTKMSQSLIEQGYIVNPNGTNKVWKSSGVYETGGIMQVWGHLFNGKRLDLLIDDISSLTQNNASQVALQALVLWLRAKMALGETRSAFNPGAAFICFENGNENYPKGTVFFGPEYLSNRCLFYEGSQLDKYNCPDLHGMEATAFCTGVMLYKILAGVHPYPSAEIYQDMREGVVLPMRLAAPALNEKLSELINAALMLPDVNKKSAMSALDIITNILKILINNEGRIVSISSLFRALPVDKTKQLEKEKNRFSTRQNAAVKTRRFLVRNKIQIITGFVIAIFAGIITFSMTANASMRPSSAGMSAENVIYAYYHAFSTLDHIFMEALLQGADKTDLNAAISYTAILKTLQAYEMSATEQMVIPASVWKEQGRALPAPNVFGVTDLTLEYLAGGDADGLTVYRTTYLLWPLNENYSLSRSDTITLRLDRKRNWRITEILRTEK
ncbi:MAG: hypothetical protein FWC22_03255 [Treponema sp.]|nr:hypothetical protein [Treponema sp.]